MRHLSNAMDTDLKRVKTTFFVKLFLFHISEMFLLLHHWKKNLSTNLRILWKTNISFQTHILNG